MHRTTQSSHDPILDVTPDLSQYLRPPVERIVCVRYFLTVTPPSEGSLVKWANPPERFTGGELLAALQDKGLSFTNHRPQVYDASLRRFTSLGDGDELLVPREQNWLFLNLRLVPRVPAKVTETTAATALVGQPEERKITHVAAEGLRNVASRAKRLLNRRAFSMDDLPSAEDEVVLELDPRTPLLSPREGAQPQHSARRQSLGGKI